MSCVATEDFFNKIGQKPTSRLRDEMKEESWIADLGARNAPLVQTVLPFVASDSCSRILRLSPAYQARTTWPSQAHLGPSRFSPTRSELARLESSSSPLQARSCVRVGIESWFNGCSIRSKRIEPTSISTADPPGSLPFWDQARRTKRPCSPGRIMAIACGRPALNIGSPANWPGRCPGVEARSTLPATVP